MPDGFDSASSDAKISDFEENLLLITPTEYREEVLTANGTKDAIVANVVVLDGPHGFQEHPELLIFPKVLISRLKERVETQRPLLGRLGKGKAKPGQSAPWTLASPSEADKALARQYQGDDALPEPGPPVTVPGGQVNADAFAGLTAEQRQAIADAQTSEIPF